jgi:hypothetical protein
MLQSRGLAPSALGQNGIHKQRKVVTKSVPTSSTTTASAPPVDPFAEKKEYKDSMFDRLMIKVRTRLCSKLA